MRNGAVRNGMIALAAVLIATLALLHARAVAGWKADPLAAAAAWPPNGEAKSRVAEALLVDQLAKTEGQLAGAVDPAAVRLARAALAADPLNPDALLVLAYEALGRGDTDSARLQFEGINLATKRDRKANAWLAQDALAREEVVRALGYFDLMLRGRETTRDRVLPVMIDTMRQDAMLPPMLELLEDNPPWAPRFWQLAIQRNPAIGNVGRLRRSLPRDYAGVTREQDENLVASLVSLGEIAEARQVVAYLAGNDDADTLLRNPEFERKPLFPPLDWQVYSEGGYGASIYPGDGIMVVSALADSSGLVARQLLALSPGTYRVSIVLEEPLEPGLGLSAAFRCEGQRGVIASYTVSEGATELAETVSPPCDAVWIELRVRAKDGLEAGEVSIDRVAIEPG